MSRPDIGGEGLALARSWTPTAGSILEDEKHGSRDPRGQPVDQGERWDQSQMSGGVRLGDRLNRPEVRSLYRALATWPESKSEGLSESLLRVDWGPDLWQDASGIGLETKLRKATPEGV